MPSWRSQLDRAGLGPDDGADVGHLSGTPLGAAIDAAPGVLMIVAGLGLIAMATLVPAWRELDRLDAQRGFIAEQADALEAQEQRYADFHAALSGRDPVLLERLAYTQLRREPTDRQTVPEPGTAPPAHGDTDPLPPGDIDRWLRVEPPSPSESLTLSPQVTAADSPSRMVRLAGGTMRYLLLLAGGLCVVAGLWWGPRREQSPEALPPLDPTA